MSISASEVVRVDQDAQWQVIENGEVVGRARAVHRPDRRWFVSVDTWRADTDELVVRAIDRDLRADLHTTVDEADVAALDRWARIGFTVSRREHEYLIPTAPETTGLGQAHVPAGIVLRSAADVDVDRLRGLDELLRADVPGSDGWVNDPQEFREYTFDPGHFDPATYLVAEADGELVGLARIWHGPKLPRLGLIGVAASDRRRGLARALLAAAFGLLHDRGAGQVSAEVDVTNAASIALLTSLGAWRTGASVELIRRHGPQAVL